MITIYRGEDTDFADTAPIEIEINTNRDLTGYTAKILFGNVVRDYTSEVVITKKLPLVFSAKETLGFFPGRGYATVKLYDQEGRVAIVKTEIINVAFKEKNCYGAK